MAELSPEQEAQIEAAKALGEAEQRYVNEYKNHSTIVAEGRSQWQVLEAEIRLQNATDAVVAAGGVVESIDVS